MLTLPYSDSKFTSLKYVRRAIYTGVA